MTQAPQVPRGVRLGAAFVMVAALALCGWQLRRDGERNAGREIALTLADTAPLGDDVPVDVSAAWHRVAWSGRWDGAPELIAGRMAHEKLGYGLVQRYARADGTVVMVDRGWVPVEALESVSTRLTHQTDAPLTGQLRPATGREDIRPTIGHGTRIWPAKAWGTINPANGVVSGVYVIEGSPTGADNGVPPVENGFAIVPDRDDTSLHYAAQWFAIAAIGGIVLVPSATRWARQFLGA